MKSRSVLLVVALASLAVALSACGSSGGTTTTVIKEVPADTSPQPSTSGTTSDDTATQSEDTGSENGGIKVPDVVGKNHQAAQDEMQAAGLFNLAEEDATGQGRLLLFDRNWKVVSQNPAAGSRVKKDATITLRSKKYTDP